MPGHFLRPSYDLAGSYDPGTDHWPPPAKPPAGLHAQAGAVAGDTVYFPGGSSSCGSDKLSLAIYALRLN